MGYSLTKKSFGTSKRSCLFTIDTDMEISNFLYVRDFGYLFICKKNHCIIFYGGNGFDFAWIGSPNQKGFRDGIRGSNYLDFPDSICYSEQHNSFYLFESGGSRIRRIEASDSNPAIMSIFGERDGKDFARYFSKLKDKTLCESSCAIDGSSIYFSFTSLNKVVMIKDSQFSNFVGNGRSGFSTASNPSECMLSRPSGIAIGNGDIYIADSGNSCIRKYCKNGLTVVAGYPLKSGDQDGKGIGCLLNHPSSLKVSDNIGYLIDGNKIKYMALSDYSVGTVFESDNMVAIDVDGRDLLILEKV